jgi:hypothetical protein
LEAIFILLIWLAPHPPFSKLLEPPIRFFFSDRVLHYPAHLWFMYHAMKHTHLVAMTLLGALMSGLVCLMVEQVEQGRSVSLYSAVKSRRVRYWRVVLIWVLSWGLARLIAELLPKVLPQIGWAAYLVVGVLIIFQSLFIYAIPFAALHALPWWRALLSSMRLMLRRPLSTLVIVLIPSLPVILSGFFFSSRAMAKVVFLTVPELVFVFIVIRLVIWTAADAFMSVAAAYMVLSSNHPKSGGSR